MKYLVIVLFVFIGLVSLAQQQGNYKFNIESKFNTDVELSVAVYYQGKDVYKQYDLIIKNTNLIIKDSLKRFDVFEMYSNQRSTMGAIINEVYKTKLKEEKVIVDSVHLVDVKIPLEAKYLNERFLELEQNYLGVVLEIDNRKKVLEQKLQSDTNISDTERKEKEKEIMVLENHAFISRIYDEKLKKLIKNK